MLLWRSVAACSVERRIALKKHISLILVVLATKTNNETMPHRQVLLTARLLNHLFNLAIINLPAQCVFFASVCWPFLLSHPLFPYVCDATAESTKVPSTTLTLLPTNCINTQRYAINYDSWQRESRGSTNLHESTFKLNVSTCFIEEHIIEPVLQIRWIKSSSELTLSSQHWRTVLFAVSWKMGGK